MFVLADTKVATFFKKSPTAIIKYIHQMKQITFQHSGCSADNYEFDHNMSLSLRTIAHSPGGPSPYKVQNS